MGNELERPEDRANHLMKTYLDCPPEKRGPIEREISSATATVKAAMTSLPDFKIFLSAFMLDAVMGLVKVTKSQLLAFKTFSTPGMVRINVNPGAVEVEAEE